MPLFVFHAEPCEARGIEIQGRLRSLGWRSMRFAGRTKLPIQYRKAVLESARNSVNTRVQRVDEVRL